MYFTAPSSHRPITPTIKHHLKLGSAENAPNADDGRALAEKEHGGLDLGLDSDEEGPEGEGGGAGAASEAGAVAGAGSDLVTAEDDGAAASRPNWAPHLFYRRSVTAAKLHEYAGHHRRKSPHHF